MRALREILVSHMKSYYKYYLLFIYKLILTNGLLAQQKIDIVEKSFLNSPESAKPWVFWYWLHGAVSKEGITADLEAMKYVGIGGAYLMPIKDTSSAMPFPQQVRQLTPEWWSMVKFAMEESKRLKLQLGIHVSDGFALAGGPWITPELSMQKLTWSKVYIKAGDKAGINLPQPETKENYYRDIAVFAYPANYKNEIVLKSLEPLITTSSGADATFLANENARQTFRSDSNCWIQYSYQQPVIVRQVKIKKQNNAYQSQRFIIQRSDDGINFFAVDTLQPPRHGWQDWDEPYTHAVKNFTARYIRFVWQKEGAEPGSEDLDAAKWRPVLRVQGINISDEPVINNYEAKNGSIWRIASNTTGAEVSKTSAVPFNKIINLTGKLGSNGQLNWTPQGNNDWIIVRIGHTSTGYTNNTGGGGKGLECDKFDPAAIRLQFNNWFGNFYKKAGEDLARQVIKIFHVDSWECGSQNWSKNFAAEFKKRKGYDLLPWLLVMTGVPVNDVAASEKVLHDVRTTIAALVNDKFYLTLKNLAHAKGVLLSAESIAPTFVSDGLIHYKHADIPMGEFWLNSPTHDKPNDMFDAISGAHIYGKNIVQAEAFTTLRSDWGEHPGNIKALGDRAFADGINKLSLHVFMHNPWMDRKPGMTLDGIGLFYQRDQTWFKQSKAWIDYLTRCQALLQLGKPVVDIGVFTGEEIPRRSILPDRLVNTLPGLYGKEKIEEEKRRIENKGQPMRTVPDGVTHSANMADPEKYIDALNGYKYDCFNPDVLMQMKVVNGRVVTPGGLSYAVLIIPGKHPMNLNAGMSDAVKNKLKLLANGGAKIVIGGELMKPFNGNKNIVPAPYMESSFEKLGVKKDVEVIKGKSSIAWTHRQTSGADIYFISNQTNIEQPIQLLFRLKGKMPEGFDPVNGKVFGGFTAHNTDDGVMIFTDLKPNQSLFFVFRGKFDVPYVKRPEPVRSRDSILLDDNWDIEFYNPISHDLVTNKRARLKSWITLPDSSLRHYSGTAVYKNTFMIKSIEDIFTATLTIDSIYNIATVKINGIDCGTLWTRPFALDIFRAIKVGENKIEIEVANTWRNRLIGDELMPGRRATWLNSPYKVKEKPLLPAGIVGEVKILMR